MNVEVLMMKVKNQLHLITVLIPKRQIRSSQTETDGLFVSQVTTSELSTTEEEFKCNTEQTVYLLMSHF